MKLCLSVLFVFMAAGSPAVSGETRDKTPQQPKVVVDLSLDLNSRDLMVSALGQVGDSVCAVVYKFDDPKLLPVLLEALRRDVELRILCDEKESGKKDSLVGELAKAGAQIRAWPRSQGKLHAKFVLCDNERVLTGSWNWTKSAGGKNLELLMDIKDDDTVETFVGVFARLWDMGQPLKY